MRVNVEPRRIGELVREHRRALGITQEQLAERAGVSPRSISELERGGEHVPRRDTLSLVARALDLAGTSRDVFEAAAEDRRRLRLQAEPVPAPDRSAHMLPRSLTRFIGRRHDLEQLTVAVGKAPLVTLVGPGGVGKTRLAQEFLRASAPRFPQGCWEVELASVVEPTLLPSAIARALGVREVRTEHVREMLVTFIADRHALLLVDNCEHLIAACAELIGELLARCPRLQILATSREPLAIDGELCWHVLPFELPSEGTADSVASLTQNSAVQLFLDRASVVTPLALTASNARTIARICVATDGIALGLELAAAATRILALEELANRLEADVGLLSAYSRSAPVRHRTLRATIDWSHDLLSDREQRLFRRLSVFARGWSLDVAEVVCTDDGFRPSEVLDVVGTLADKSLIVVDVAGSTTRYRFLETVRQYALERLEAAGEDADYRSRHAAYFLGLARRGIQASGPEEIVSIQRIELEHANVRTALGWALSQGQTEAAVTAATALFRFWERRGHCQEGCNWLEQAIAREDFAAVPARARCGALNALAFLYWRNGASACATPIAERALGVSRAAGFTRGMAEALLNMGMSAFLQRQYVAAESALESAVTHLRGAERPPMLSVGLSFLARVMLIAHGPADPRLAALMEESVRLAHASQSRYASGHALATEGDVHWARGEVARAMTAWKGALILFSDLADPRGTAGCVERLALALLRDGYTADAAWLFGAADAQHAALGMPLRRLGAVDHAHVAHFEDQQEARAAFPDAWAAGRSASMHDSVARAIDNAQRLQPA